MSADAAISLHMILTEKAPIKEVRCANCRQKITRWTLPQPGHPEDEGEAWYHLCVDPIGLKHLYLHSTNDYEQKEKNIRGFWKGECFRAEPVRSEETLRGIWWMNGMEPDWMTKRKVMEGIKYLTFENGQP